MNRNNKQKSMLANLRDVLYDAKENNYAVAQININNLEWIKAVLSAANESSSPIILGVSESAGRYMGGFKNVHDMIINLINYYNISVPVVLHLDHGTFEGCIQALEAGFSSVMFDGSSFSFDINFNKTYEIIQIAQRFNASVEAEIGGIGELEQDGVNLGENANLEECITISRLPIDALAASIGSIHGIYPENWQSLNFDLLNDVNAACDNLPLVLHGGSGIPNDQIKKAIALGICKINVNTECQLAFSEAIRKYILDNKDLDILNKGYDPRKMLKVGAEAIKKVCLTKFKLFGSLGVCN